MTAPRPVFPNRSHFSTRRTTQRQFLLRPDEETNNNFVYCLAEAAQRFDMNIVLAQMMSDHHHTVNHDVLGLDVEFREHFHKMLARCQNAYRGRWENLWASEEPCVVDLMSADDLMDKLVYVATNPVKHGLVERVHHWPGPKLVQALLTGTPMKAYRPKHFFRDQGSMPAEVELVLRLPDYIENKEAFLAELRRRITSVEEQHISERMRTGRRVIGRRRILRTSWRESPTSREPRRTLRPRVAARDPSLRILTLQAMKDWQLEYHEARVNWLVGAPSEFPFGTYWLRRFATVVVKPPSPSFALA